MKIDDFLFEPCGYSMNGILKNENIDFGLVSNFNIIGTTVKRDYSNNNYLYDILEIYIFYSGRIHDHSHHTRARLFLR